MFFWIAYTNWKICIEFLGIVSYYEWSKKQESQQGKGLYFISGVINKNKKYIYKTRNPQHLPDFLSFFVCLFLFRSTEILLEMIVL